MANTMRWRYGDTNPVMAPVLSATDVEIGDLVYLDAGTAKPASLQADQSSLLLNQAKLKDGFLGVAMQGSPAGVENSIRVATTGVFEFECAAATFKIGDLVGAAENTAGTLLLDQTVLAAATIDAAIGRCAKRVDPAGTRVLVDLVSTAMRGGANAA